MCLYPSVSTVSYYFEIVELEILLRWQVENWEKMWSLFFVIGIDDKETPKYILLVGVNLQSSAHKSQ